MRLYRHFSHDNSARERVKGLSLHCCDLVGIHYLCIYGGYCPVLIIVLCQEQIIVNILLL